MILVLHILIALTSLAHTTYTYFVPSKAKLAASYALIGLTLGSGTYLVVSMHSPMLQSCMSGLFYLGVVTFGLAAAHHRLAVQTARSNSHRQE